MTDLIQTLLANIMLSLFQLFRGSAIKITHNRFGFHFIIRVENSLLYARLIQAISVYLVK